MGNVITLRITEKNNEKHREGWKTPRDAFLQQDEKKGTQNMQIENLLNQINKRKELCYPVDDNRHYQDCRNAKNNYHG